MAERCARLTAPIVLLILSWIQIAQIVHLFHDRVTAMQETVSRLQKFCLHELATKYSILLSNEYH